MLTCRPGAAMDYEEQRTFLKRQRWRLLPAGLGCGALLVQTVRGRAPLWARIAGGLLAFGLLWAAYYLPNYLGLDAGAIRRPRWVARARWFVLALTGLVGCACSGAVCRGPASGLGENPAPAPAL